MCFQASLLELAKQGLSYYRDATVLARDRKVKMFVVVFFSAEIFHS